MRTEPGEIGSWSEPEPEARVKALRGILGDRAAYVAGGAVISVLFVLGALLRTSGNQPEAMVSDTPPGSMTPSGEVNEAVEPEVGTQDILGAQESEEEGEEEGREPVPLVGEIDRSDTDILVMNHDSVAWRDCRVSFRRGFLDGGFSADVGEVAPGDTASVPILVFADGSDRRFNPIQQVIRAVTIRCETDYGPGVGEADLRPRPPP
jgi:hypothetical protein